MKFMHMKFMNQAISFHNLHMECYKSFKILYTGYALMVVKGPLKLATIRTAADDNFATLSLIFVEK